MKLRIKVKPGAPEDRFLGLGDDGIVHVAISARPTKGEANRALIRFLALAFGLPAKDIKITSGASSRLKVVDVPGLGPERLKELLG
ncbi:MAG: DUF167 domain-containing protein [candidate division WOR-3 bacterium]